MHALRPAAITAIKPWLTLNEQSFPLEALAGHTGLVELDLVQINDALTVTGNWAELWRLTRLETLRLPAPVPSFFAQIEQLSQLTRLQHLQLHNTGIKQLPSGLTAVTTLTELHLVNSVVNIGLGNHLEGGWEHLRSLPRLLALRFNACGLRRLPSELAHLTGLSLLGLSSNVVLWGGWEHLGPLKRLRELDLSHCSLVELPEEVSCLTALTCLALGGNEDLTDGWEHLLPLQQLQELVLFQSGMSEVPELIELQHRITQRRRQ